MRAEIYWIQENFGLPGLLAVGPRPRAGDWLVDEVNEYKAAGVDHVVSLLTPFENIELGLDGEAEVIEGAGLSFVQCPVEDRSIPGSQVAFRGVADDVHQLLVHGKNVFIHCRQGIGRSSLLAAAVIVLAGQSPHRAFEVIERWRGRPVPDTDEQRSWLETFAIR